MWEWICTINLRNVENSPAPVFLLKLLIFSVSGSFCKGYRGVFAPRRVCSEGSHAQEHTDKPEGHTRSVVVMRRSCSVALTENGMWSVGTFLFQDFLRTLPTRKGRETKHTDRKTDKLMLTKTITRNKLSHTS